MNTTMQLENVKSVVKGNSLHKALEKASTIRTEKVKNGEKVTAACRCLCSNPSANRFLFFLFSFFWGAGGNRSKRWRRQ